MTTTTGSIHPSFLQMPTLTSQPSKSKRRWSTSVSSSLSSGDSTVMAGVLSHGLTWDLMLVSRSYGLPFVVGCAEQCGSRVDPHTRPWYWVFWVEILGWWGPGTNFHLNQFSLNCTEEFENTPISRLLPKYHVSPWKLSLGRSLHLNQSHWEHLGYVALFIWYSKTCIPRLSIFFLFFNF